jgi:hypothetical protein
MEMGIAVLGSLIARLPLFIVWIVAVVLAVSRWEKHRTVSILVLIAVVVELVLAVVGTAASVMLPRWMMERGLEHIRVASAMSLVGAGQSAISAVCWGLVIAAAFMKRPAAHASSGTR